MDKRKLNNEIVLCRAAVRKAKVATIRKLLKHMKILKSCKIEAVKEKKLRKSKRLFKKVQVMKKIKDDEVTKFALRHTDIEAFLKGPKPKLRQSAMAYLAKHQAVAEKVNFIREQFQNWEMELPILLDSLGKTKKKVVNAQEIAKSSFKTTAVNSAMQCNTVIKGGGIDEQIKKKVSLRELKVRQDKKTAKLSDQSLRTSSDGGRTNKEVEKLETVKKIVDPFFVGKKIVAPKLVLESALNKQNSDKLEKLDLPVLEREKSNSVFDSKASRGRRNSNELGDKNSNSVFDSKASRGRRNSNEFSRQKPLSLAEEEKLHPSWAAKKVKLIQPFQGKKITFSDD